MISNGIKLDVIVINIGLMGCSLLPNALRPFKINCAPPTNISQLVLFVGQSVEIDPLGHARVVEALQNFVHDTNYQVYHCVAFSALRSHLS